MRERDVIEGGPRVLSGIYIIRSKQLFASETIYQCTVYAYE